MCSRNLKYIMVFKIMNPQIHPYYNPKTYEYFVRYSTKLYITVKRKWI